MVHYHFERALMGFSYLGGKTWEEISREERFFCARLYEHIRNSPNEFVRWLKTLKPHWMELNNKDTKNIENIDHETKWEAGYEVCFYRDVAHVFNKDKELLINKSTRDKNGLFSPKRTFDLALFSENCVVIIEAKCCQIFESEQLGDINEDKKAIPELLSHIFGRTYEKPDVYTIALASSKYYPRIKSASKEKFKDFDACISWHDIFHYTGDWFFKHVDELYDNH